MGGDMFCFKLMDRNIYDVGDWFNYVDFIYEINNWNVGLLLVQDNEVCWEEMGEFIYSLNCVVLMVDIMFVLDVFVELLNICMISLLFRLIIVEDIIDCIGFYNIGECQQCGFIVMSIDDGVLENSEVFCLDLDMMNDVVMVLVNIGYEEKFIMVNIVIGFLFYVI